MISIPRNTTRLAASAGLLALVLAPSIQSQASFVNYGRGCTIGGPPPLIRSTGTPKINTTFTVRYIGPNGRTPVSEDWPVLITGLSATAVTIPKWSTVQPTGCTVLVNPLIFTPMAWNGSRFIDSASLAIPNDRSLIGAVYRQQWMTLYSSCRPTCTLLMFRMSDAATITIGA